MAKLIKISESKAYRINGVKIKGENYLNIRQMYKTQKMKKYAPSRKGLTLPIDEAARVLKVALKLANDETLEFETLYEEE